jgi:uncharacterized coiled-coil DUF342 family protein|tara:strand:+ start:9794 stop:9982 length:189 start_codon:yes stop_codon:yes gene_type:complete
METYEKNIKEALDKLPAQHKALVERRGDLQVAINDAREWGDDTTKLREQMREINEKINKYKK